MSDCSVFHPHPYQCELDNHVPDERFLDKADVQVGAADVDELSCSFLNTITLA